MSPRSCVAPSILPRLLAGTAGVLALAWASGSAAGPADVLAAEARCQGERCHFRVTLRHADEGWDHYADAWQVLAPDGTGLATRTLHHPHVDEQPFTRSLRDVKVPEGLTRVRVRGRDSVHGFGGAEVEVTLSR